MSSQGSAMIEASDEEELPPKYKNNQSVFCQEKENVYEAFVRKTSFKDGKWTYLVHFAGWNTRWDQWVGDSALREPTEELRLQAAAQEEKAKKEEKPKKEEAKAKKVNLADRKRKKGDSEGDDRGKRRYESGSSWEDYCELPFTLKTILVDEKDRVMRVSFNGPNAGVDTDFEPGHWRTARDVHNLPASVTIKTVMNHYVKMKRKEAAPEKAALVEKKAKSFVEGLSKLFEEALPVCLLYHPERAQYIAVNSDPATKSLRETEIYGCEFLLRLFVRLPGLLEHLGDTTSRREMGQHLTDLIILLQKNRSACFKCKYREPTREELNDYEKAL
jgi:mortality factor 4-like protein 1